MEFSIAEVGGIGDYTEKDLVGESRQNSWGKNR